jgi:hypothetical protein
MPNAFMVPAPPVPGGSGGGVAKTKNFIVGRSGSAVFLLYFVHELR